MLLNKKITTLAMLAMAAAFAIGQEAPPAAPPEEEEEEVVAPKWNHIQVSFNSRDLSGNRYRFRQYGTVHDGISLSNLELFTPLRGRTPYVRVRGSGLGADDQVGYARLMFANGNLEVRYGETDYRDVTPVLTPDSNRKDLELRAQYALREDLGVYWQYQRRTKEQNFEAPKPTRRSRVQNFAGGIQGELLGGNAGLTIGDSRFYDRVGTQPDAIRRRISAFYAKDFADNLSIEGTWAQSTITQRNRPDSKFRSAGLNGEWFFGSDTHLAFGFRKDEFDTRVVENAYVRDRFSGSARLYHRLGSSSMQLGYRRVEAERVRGDRSFVDVPTWNTYDGRWAGKLNDAVRFTLKGSYQHLGEGARMTETSDSRRLFWDDRVRASMKLDTGNDRFNGYFIYSYRYDQNGERGLEVRNDNVTLGGSYQMSDRMLGFFEFARDTYEAKGVIDEAGLNLDDFFPTATSFTVGIDGTLTPESGYSATFTHFVSGNANPLLLGEGNVRSTQFTATYRRQLTADTSLEVFLAPWRYRDRVIDSLGYRATVFGVTFGTRF